MKNRTIPSRQTIIRCAAAGAIGLTTGLAYFNQMVRPQMEHPAAQIASLVYLAGLFAILAYVILFRWLELLLEPFPARRAIGWGMIGATMLALPIFIILIRPPQPPRSHQLEIIAPGQKNPASLGSEVWLIDVQRPGDQRPAFHTLARAGDWELHENKLVSRRAQPAALHWEGTLEGSLRLRFLRHAWSGIAQIQWDQQIQEIDLYASGEFPLNLEIVLPSETGTAVTESRAAYWGRLLLAGADVAAVAGLVFAVVTWVAVWRRYGGLPLRFPARPRHLLLPLFLGVPLIWPLAPVIGAADQLRPIDYLAAWLCAVLITAVGLGLSCREEDLLALAPARLPRRLGTIVLGQTRGAWLLAALAVGLGAALITDRFPIGGPAQRATWVKLALDALGPGPPEAQLRYGPGTGDTIPFQWQPYAESILAVRPLGDQPARVLTVETDQGPLGLSEITSAETTPDASGLDIPAPNGALLNWARPSRAITITLAPGVGSAELLWLDQQIIVALGPQPARAALRLPASFQGWALLPPREVRDLAIDLAAGEQSYRIRQLEVVSNPPQRWPEDTGWQRWNTQGCALGPDGSITAVNGPCVIQAADVRPINPRDRVISLIQWALLTLLALALLWALARVARLLARHLPATPASGQNQLGARVPRAPAAGTIWLVWVIALGFHLIYALSMPLGFVHDSLGYYGYGRILAEAFRFAEITGPGIRRTPGYPALIAATVRIFGDNVLWLILLQHLALSALAPLAVWALARTTSRAIAVAAGLLVGISPALSAIANMLYTEALFAACATATLLAYVARGNRLRGLLAVGLLSGIATLIRPTGLLLVPVLVGWLLLVGWCAPAGGAGQRFALAGCGALVVGYLGMAAPWHLHLWFVRETTDISQGLAGNTAWVGTSYLSQFDERLVVNRPDRPVWAIPGWNNSGYELFDRYPYLITGISKTFNSQTYYTEALREAAEANPAQVAEDRRRALVYNLTFRWYGARPDIVWQEISEFLSGTFWPQLPASEPEPGSLPQLLNALAYRWQPAPAPARSICIALSNFVLQHWIYLAIPALLSLAPLFALPRLRSLVPCWLYWLGLVISVSAIGMPVERYSVVAEPLLYILAIVPAAALVGLVYRAVKHTRRTEQTTAPAPIEQINT